MSASSVAAVAVERLSADAYQIDSGLKYVDVFKLEPLFAQMFAQPSPPNVLLAGPKGVAKSLSAQHFAAKNKIPVIVCECSEDVRRANLVGMFIMRGDATPFILGDLTSAIEVANEVGKAMLILEEVNALSPQAQKILNPLCDFRRKISVPECGRVFSLKAGAKLWVVGTMNSSVYGGVYTLNEDLKSRFRILPLGYPEPNEEKSIVAAVVPNADAKLVTSVLRLAADTRQPSFGYALSTRDVVQLVQDATLLGVAQALRLVSGKYEDTDRAHFIARAQSVFGKVAI